MMTMMMFLTRNMSASSKTKTLAIAIAGVLAVCAGCTPPGGELLTRHAAASALRTSARRRLAKDGWRSTCYADDCKYATKARFNCRGFLEPCLKCHDNMVCSDIWNCPGRGMCGDCNRAQAQTQPPPVNPGYVPKPLASGESMSVCCAYKCDKLKIRVRCAPCSVCKDRMVCTDNTNCPGHGKCDDCYRAGQVRKGSTWVRQFRGQYKPKPDEKGGKRSSPKKSPPPKKTPPRKKASPKPKPRSPQRSDSYYQKKIAADTAKGEEILRRMRKDLISQIPKDLPPPNGEWRNKRGWQWGRCRCTDCTMKDHCSSHGYYRVGLCPSCMAESC